jgi:lysozyme
MKLDWNLSYGQVFKSPLVLAEEIAKPFEKCSLKSYWDCAGYPTNGWGNLLSRVRLQTIMQQNGWTRKQADLWLYATYPEITQDVADEDFRINLNKAFSSVKRLVKIPLSIEQVAALIDFAFNCGGGNLQISTLLRMINRGDLYDAAEEFPKWNKAGGVVMRGLTKRRLSEKRLFLSGMK